MWEGQSTSRSVGSKFTAPNKRRRFVKYWTAGKSRRDIVDRSSRIKDEWRPVAGSWTTWNKWGSPRSWSLLTWGAYSTPILRLTTWGGRLQCVFIWEEKHKWACTAGSLKAHVYIIRQLLGYFSLSSLSPSSYSPLHRLPLSLLCLSFPSPSPPVKC